MNEFEMETSNNENEIATDLVETTYVDHPVEPVVDNHKATAKAYAIGGAVGAAGGVAAGFFLVPRIVSFYRRRKAARLERKLAKMKELENDKQSDKD